MLSADASEMAERLKFQHDRSLKEIMARAFAAGHEDALVDCGDWGYRTQRPDGGLVSSRCGITSPAPP